MLGEKGSDGIFAETLVFNQRIGRMTDADAVFSALVDYARLFGFSGVALGHIVSPARVDLRAEGWFGFHNWPQEWAQRWIERDMMIHDPVSRFTMASSRPFVWSEAQKEAPAFGRAVAAQAGLFGLKDGFAIPVRLPGRPLGCVSLGGSQRIDLSPAELVCVEMSAAHAYARLEELFGAEVAEERPPRLSPREVEVLHWVAEGKSNWEIGEILDCAESTATKHVGSLMQKLGAVSRAHAVTIAFGKGLLNP